MPLVPRERDPRAPFPGRFSACCLALGIVVFALACADDRPPAGPRRGAPAGSATVSLRLRRLTQAELRNTLTSVLAVDPTMVAELSLPADGSVEGYVDNRDAPMTPLAADQYASMAERVAQSVDLAALAPCAPARADRECAGWLLETTGRAAFRRPLPDGERQALLALFDEIRARDGSEQALRSLIAAIVQSPYFLFHLDVPDPDSPHRVDVYALASRMSFLLFQAPPDDALLDAAARGELDTDRGRAEHARRMLRDPRSRNGITAFFRQWLDLAMPRELARDSERYPTYTPAVAAAMLEETDSFVDYVVRQGDGRLETLLTASWSFVPPALRPVYGLAEGPADAPVALDPSQRAGLLTHASVLASHSRFSDSSPVLRGVFLYRRVLCGQLGDPPADVDTSLDPLMPGEVESTAERLARHREDPVCASCHDSIDPPGLAFEHYGALGEWRDDDDGAAIPPPPPLTGTDVDGALNSAVELSERLSTSRRVQDCLVHQWMTHSGLPFSAEDQVWLEERFQSSGHDVADLMAATVAAPSFALRSTSRSPR